MWGFIGTTCLRLLLLLLLRRIFSSPLALGEDDQYYENVMRMTLKMFMANQWIMKDCRVFLLSFINVMVNVRIDQVARTSQKGGFKMSKAEIRKSLLKEKSWANEKKRIGQILLYDSRFQFKCGCFESWMSKTSIKSHKSASQVEKFSNHPGKLSVHLVVLHVDVVHADASHAVVFHLRHKRI